MTPLIFYSDRKMYESEQGTSHLKRWIVAPYVSRSGRIYEFTWKDGVVPIRLGDYTWSMYLMVSTLV